MRLPARIPFPLLRRSRTGYPGAGWLSDGTPFDYVIAGIPLVSAANKENPLRIRTVPLENTVFTSSDGPSENTLTVWWMEGQSSWHGGAGLLYRDGPNVQKGGPEAIRYRLSRGVDVWTPGEVKLLPKTLPAHLNAGPGLHVATGWRSTGEPVFVEVTETTVTLVQLTGYTGSTQVWSATPLTNVSATFGTVRQSVIVGGTVWVLAEKGVFKIPLSTWATPSAAYFTWPAGIDWQKSQIAFVRERLIVLAYKDSRPVLVEADQNAATGALPAPTYTMPTPASEWTGIADGPAGFYTILRTRDRGYMHRWGIDATGTVPKIMAPIQVAEFPQGEYPTSLAAYVGTTIGVTTNRGFRVAEIRTDGSIEYGPNLIGDGLGTVALGVCGRDRFLYAGYTSALGVPGALRVDLGQPLSAQQYAYQPAQRYAWAPDVSAWTGDAELGGGSVSQVLTYGDLLLLVIPGQGVWCINPRQYVPTGELESSVLRWNTLELKQLRFARMVCESSTGSVHLAIGDNPGTGSDVISMTPSQQVDSGDVSLFRPPTSTVVVTLRLVRPAADIGKTPVVKMWQLKASPAQPRQHLMSIPVQLFDHETDRSGGDLRNQGAALARILQLEEIIRTGSAVDFTVWHAYPEQRLSRMVTIEEIQYTQEDSPRTESAWGGIANVVLRTME